MNILVCDDDREIVNAIEIYLSNEGYTVFKAYDGLEALNVVEKEELHLIIMDVMMPKMDGHTLLRQLRAQGNDIPVLFLTARDSVADRVEGLDLGADDYLVKPFAFEELLARIRVLIRKNSVSNSNIITVADLTVDISSRKVARGGKDILLSAKEYELLQYLAVNNGIVLSREKIEDHIWNYDYEGGTNVVDVYIRYLRKKIDEGYNKKLIHTVRGMGYVLREEK